MSFRSLAQHLLALYPVPGFLESAWDLPAGADSFRQQAWYIRLGRGASLRSLNLPITLTRRMEHHARRAPDHYTAVQALRYGEVRGVGGSEMLAREVIASRLGWETQHADFWRSVLRFLATHFELAGQQAEAIIGFIHAQKFAGEEILTANGRESRAAPWPGFSIDGRTPQSLLRLVCAWRLDLRDSDRTGLSWDVSGFRAYRYVEKSVRGEDLDWSMVELLNNSALCAEGRAMRHCVASYATRCWRGDSAIWSLRLRAGGLERRMATIEVDPRRRAIVQVRAKWNRPAENRSVEIIRHWAVWAGLQYGLCE